RTDPTSASDSQNFTKTIRSNRYEESPLSPPMTWSREGTGVELSKYQELQMRQRNDVQCCAQGQELADSAPSNIADATCPDLTTKRDDMKAYLEPTSSIVSILASSSRSGSSSGTGTLQRQDIKHGKRSTRQGTSLEQSTGSTLNGLDEKKKSKTSLSSTTRSPRISRSKAAVKDGEEGRQRGMTLSTPSVTAARPDPPGQSQNGLTSVRQRAATLPGMASRYQWSSCQQERVATSPSPRPYLYGQYLGSNEPMPLYAGPLGLGDDIPSPTPSPPASGRLSIHMAISSHSPINSPSSSPLLSMPHSSLPVPTGTRGRSRRRNHQEGVSGMTSPHAPDGRLMDGYGSSGSAGSASTNNNHPVIMGFHNQAHDPKVRNSKK
ncbi:hypothetical protein BGZ65_009854, partial [Modicella reniformis]